MIALYGYDQYSQPYLPGFAPGKHDLAQLKRHTIGKLGELTVWQALERSGYTVQRSRRHLGDLTAISCDGVIHRVEVKTARSNRDKKWRFSLFKAGCTDWRDSDVVVLLPVLDNCTTIPFVIPVSALPGHSCVITSDPSRYAGRLAVWRQESPLSLEL